MENKAGVFVALAMALVVSQAAQDAHASACSIARTKYNAAVDADGDQYLSAIKQSLGILPKQVVRSNPDHCRKMIPILQARLPRLIQLGQLSATMTGACSKIHWVDDSTNMRNFNEPGSQSTAPLIAELNRIVSGCLQVIAKADALQQDAAAQSPASSPNDQRTASSTVMRQPANCSDISGLGGSGPSKCAPSTGVPANLQAQIDKARSSLQAAQTVKQSDPSRNGQAAAAADQAQATEIALNSDPGQSAAAPQIASGDQANAAPSDDANSCPPAIPASFWQNGLNAVYCAKATVSCVERGSALYGYLCAPDAATAAEAQEANPPAWEQYVRSKLSRMRRSYKPPMSPQALRSLAFTACKDVSLADKPRCIEDAEVGILLGSDGVVGAACASIAESIARHNQAVDEGPGPDWLKAARQWVCGPDPNVRADCGSIQDKKAQVECVDAVYVRGPGAYGTGLGSTLQKSIGGGQ